MDKEHLLLMEETTYEGEWKDGKRNGQGVDTSTDGYKIVGKWKNGLMWNAITTKEGKFQWKYVNGKTIYEE